MPARPAAGAVAALTIGLTVMATARAAQPEPFDLVLRGGRVVDGTGNPWVAADVGVRGDRIAAIGSLSGLPAKRALDVAGLVVSPGFIDMLGQSEFTVLADPRLLSKITQGITTELTGEGSSAAPMTAYTIGEVQRSLSDLGLTIGWSDFKGYFDQVGRKGTAVNFAHLVGAAEVRMAVLKGEERAPTPDEMEEMRLSVARAMEQGAFGLSSSLIYPPGIFATTDELVELAKAASRYGGFYASHVRNEASRLPAALDEAAAIGERARIPVEIWHLKSAGKAQWGRMPEILKTIASYRERGIDMTADMYPYPAAATDLSACLPPSASAGGIDKLVERLKDPAQRALIRKEIESPSPTWESLLANTGGPDGVLVAGVRVPANRKYQGKRVSEIAAMRKVDPLDAIFDLLVSEDGTVDAIYFQMSEEDVRAAMASAFVSFDCDAPGVQPDGPLGRRMIHPRAYGTFPRILGRYVRDAKVLDLEEAIRKMTSLPARRLGLRDRGLLAPGMAADVTVFDPAKVIDVATFEEPHRFSEGIVHVLVNGEPVIEGGRPTGRLPGRILRGPAR